MKYKCKFRPISTENTLVSWLQIDMQATYICQYVEKCIVLNSFN